MSLADIREQIKTILSGVDGIGVVHDYERWASDWKKFLDFFRVEDDYGKKTINGWMFSRRSTPSDRDTMPTLKRRHMFRFSGIYVLNDSDASEIIFQDIVENIQDAFDSQYTLGGIVINSGPVQVVVVENRMFGGILCHYAQLDYEVFERKTYS